MGFIGITAKKKMCATLLMGIYHTIKKKDSKKILYAVAYKLANNLHAGNCVHDLKVPRNLKIVCPSTFSPLWSFLGMIVDIGIGHWTLDIGIRTPIGTSGNLRFYF